MIDAFNKCWFGTVRFVNQRKNAFETSLGAALSAARASLPWLTASVTLTALVALTIAGGGYVLLGSSLPGIGVYLGLLTALVLAVVQMLIGMQYLAQR